MPVEITIELSDSGSQVLNIEELDPILVEIGVLPDLNQSWFGSASADKNTFVDANQAEITTFLDVLPTVALSVEGAAAVTNIQSNGGVLTDAEKFFVNRWVNRMVANSDWSLMDDLAYAGFADDSCKLTKWISGDLMTNNGATFDGQNWVFDGTNYISSNYLPDGLGNYTQNDSIVGAYINKNDNPTKSGMYLWGGGNAIDNYIYQDFGNTRLRFKNNGASNNEVANHPSWFDKGLYTAARTGANITNIYLNATDLGTDVGASTGLPETNDFNIGGSASSASFEGEIPIFFVGAAIGFDQLDFYLGFEDFRTSLHPEILYNLPQPTGQTTVYRTGDDADIETKTFQHFRTAQSNWKGTAPKLADFLTLHKPNDFYNTNLNNTLTEQDAAVARYTGLTATQESTLRQYVHDLVTANLYDKIDEYYPLFFGASNGLIGIKSKTATNNGATFDSDGAIFDGASYIDSNFNPSSDGTSYLLNSAFQGAFIKTINVSGVQHLIGANTGANARSEIFHTGSSRTNAAINGSATTPNPDIGDMSNNSLFIGSRYSNTLASIYKKGLPVSAVNTGAVTIPTTSFFIGALSTSGVPSSYIDATISSVVLGGATDFDQLTFQQIHDKFLQANGIVTGETLVDIPTQFYNRFTDVDGLQVYGDDLVIDNYTGLGWYRISNGSNVSFNSSIDSALGSTQGGFSDWFIPSMYQGDSIRMYNNSIGSGRSLNYSPFNLQEATMWTSTTDSNVVSRQLVGRTTSYTAGTWDSVDGSVTLGEYILCRKHF